jgi:hypothetical protein
MSTVEQEKMLAEMLEHVQAAQRIAIDLTGKVQTPSLARGLDQAYSGVQTAMAALKTALGK